jgi:hypothetical protein
MSQPSILDLQTPFDITALSEITFAQLQQWLSGTTPFQGKGLIEITADIAGVPQVPDANTNPKWQSYLWIRQGATSVTPYVWNPNGSTDATFLNWVTVSSVSIAPGSITGSQIAPSTITASNISSVLGTQVIGFNTAWLAASSGSGYSANGLLTNTTAYPSGGLLGGTFGNPTLANASIGPGVLAPQSISGGTNPATSNIITGAITTLQLLNNGGVSSSSSQQQSTAAIDPQANIMVLNKSLVGTPNGANFSLSASGVSVAPGDLLGVNYDATLSQAGLVQIRKAITSLIEPTANNATAQVPVVPANTIASGNIVPYSLQNPQGANGGAPFGRLLQKVQFTNGTKKSNTGNIASSSASVVSNTTGLTLLFSDTFTPFSNASALFVRAILYLYPAVTDVYSFGGIFTTAIGTGTAAPIAFGISLGGTSSNISPLVIEGNFVPGSTSLITFYLGFGVTGSSAIYTNSIDGSSNVFGGLLSSLIVEEYL